MPTDPFPHRYDVTASASHDSADVMLAAENVPALPTGRPPQFGGTKDQWSPETLLVAAVADCYALTFRGVARASQLAWLSVSCDVEGTLERVDRVTRFTRFAIRVLLHVPDGTDLELARRVLKRAEDTCLVTRSLSAETQLDAQIDVVRADVLEPAGMLP